MSRRCAGWQRVEKKQLANRQVGRTTSEIYVATRPSADVVVDVAPLNTEHAELLVKRLLRFAVQKFIVRPKMVITNYHLCSGRGRDEQRRTGGHARALPGRHAEQTRTG